MQEFVSISRTYVIVPQCKAPELQCLCNSCVIRSADNI